MAIPIRPIATRVDGLRVSDLFAGLLFNLRQMHGLAHFHRDVRVVNILHVDDEGEPRIIADDSVTERKPKEKKRERRPTGMTTEKKSVKQAKTAEQRRMKLQYKSDAKSNKSRRLPARFVRR